ncbi:MAG: hypothetical protein ACD_62C00169G0016 [uncultured bacterium]|nr:MAG: hypothetical protein ACD_62C00169G0016 [uncultured bacterium]
MKNKISLIDPSMIGDILNDLVVQGWRPVMIGGLALVILGSERVTRDVDFVIKNPRHRIDEFVKTFYKKGFVLASQINDRGQIIKTFKTKQEAIHHLKINKPTSAFFYNSKTGLKIDLLFDFPISASKLLKEAIKLKIDSKTFWIASPTHLFQLKQLAVTSRGDSRDKQDLEFLKKLLKNNN